MKRDERIHLFFGSIQQLWHVLCLCVSFRRAYSFLLPWKEKALEESNPEAKAWMEKLETTQLFQNQKSLIKNASLMGVQVQ